MRENRTYGLEGGEARAFPTPIKGDEGKPCTLQKYDLERRGAVVTGGVGFDRQRRGGYICW